jgi:hypothetical protein
MTPTLANKFAALPPEGAQPPWGGPAEADMTPTLANKFAALPPRGPSLLGAARRRLI